MTKPAERLRAKMVGRNGLTQDGDTFSAYQLTEQDVLSAAALLEECERVLAHLHDVFLDTDGTHGDLERDARDAARATLAKLRGEQ